MNRVTSMLLTLALFAGVLVNNSYSKMSKIRLNINSAVDTNNLNRDTQILEINNVYKDCIKGITGPHKEVVLSKPIRKVYKELIAQKHKPEKLLGIRDRKVFAAEKHTIFFVKGKHAAGIQKIKYHHFRLDGEKNWDFTKLPFPIKKMVASADIKSTWFGLFQKPYNIYLDIYFSSIFPIGKLVILPSDYPVDSNFTKMGEIHEKGVTSRRNLKPDGKTTKVFYVYYTKKTWSNKTVVKIYKNLKNYTGEILKLFK